MFGVWSTFRNRHIPTTNGEKLKGIPSVVIRVDDILVSGINDTEHL